MAEQQMGAGLRAGGLDAASLLQGIPDPVVLIDSRRRVMAFNAAAAALFPALALERDLVQGVRHPVVLDAVERALSEGRSHAAEIELHETASRAILVHVAALPGEIEIGRVAAIAVFHDLTAVRRAEEMRSDFVANASHELRSPLTALLGLIETLRNAARDDAEARVRFLDIMHDEALRMTRLIDDLLSLSRIESREHIAPRSRIDVREILESLAELFRPRAAERSMTIETAIPGGLPWVSGDRDELVQVFENLIENAIKYGSAGTPIRISARAVERMPDVGGEGVAVAVRDQGEGVEREHIPRLTERFYRVDKGRSRSMGGTGLGLAIVKHIVNRHRGALAIESETGRGSCFTVYLPRAAESAGGKAH